ncbi:hypothetical protein ABZV93_22645 [Actinopolymorpha sp. NPDC004070]|uniref:hypothetical protein n=1 Tax=Actinopolymorpha sp. NPDC004070 TaxID=3154548 RepID=UPI0033A2647A
MINRSGQAVMRLLVLGLLTLGVMGMHTLGHPSSHHAPADAAMAMGGEAPSITPGMHLLAPSHQPGAPGMALNPLSVCLGVLTALGLAIALRLVWLRRVRGTAARRSLAVGVGGSATRGPPGWPVGLHLADLSVQPI